MHLSIPTVASLLLAILILPSYASAQQPLPGKGEYHLQLSDSKTYDIQYSITNATLQSMTIDEPTVTLSVTITTDESPTGGNNAGTISLTIPRDLADKMANIGSLAIFVDEEGMSYKEVSSSCDYQTISIDFPAGSDSIEIVGTSAPSLAWTSNSTYSMPVNLDVTIDSKTYSVGTRGFAKLCSWDFDKEEKKMAIHYADGYNLTTISISMPKELLGAPYAVIVDGKQLDTNNSRNFNQTEYELLNSVGYNDLSIHTDISIKNIEVIGTTVAPEFSSLVSFVIMAGIMGFVIMVGRMTRYRNLRT